MHELKRGCRDQNIDYVQLRTDTPLNVALSSYLAHRLTAVEMTQRRLRLGGSRQRRRALGTPALRFAKPQAANMDAHACSSHSSVCGRPRWPPAPAPCRSRSSSTCSTAAASRSSPGRPCASCSRPRSRTRGGMRLEQLLLLLVPLCLVALLVFAMASVMPWAETRSGRTIWPEGGGPAAPRGSRIHHVFVLDGSLSMNAASRWAVTAFERARQLARRQDRAGPGRRRLQRPPHEGQPGLDRRRAVGGRPQGASASSRRCEPATATPRSPATLNMVAGQARRGRRPLSRRRWSTSSPTCRRRPGPACRRPTPRADAADKAQGRPSREIQKYARTVFVDVGRDDRRQPRRHRPRHRHRRSSPPAWKRRSSATVQQLRQETKSNVRVELLVGKARRGRRRRAADAARGRPGDRRRHGRRSRRGRTSPTSFPTPGTYVVQVRLERRPARAGQRPHRRRHRQGHDPGAARQRQARRRPLRPGHRVPAARPQPVPARAPSRSSRRLRPKVVNLRPVPGPARGRSCSTSTASSCATSPSSAPPSCAGSTPTCAAAAAWSSSLGDKALENLDLYNRLLFKNEQGLLPAQLVKKVDGARRSTTSRLHAQEDQFLEPPLKAFADDDDRVSLKTGRFRKYVEAKPAARRQGPHDHDLHARASPADQGGVRQDAADERPGHPRMEPAAAAEAPARKAKERQGRCRRRATAARSSSSRPRSTWTGRAGPARPASAP